MLNRVYTLLGLGLGPANLALATAIAERASEQTLSNHCLFVDQKPQFNWHPGMLLPGSKLQVPFIRDLATLRNPQSPFTFLNYLKKQQRLDQFINLRTFYPTRAEFYHYLLWVSQQLQDYIRFNFEVTAISPHWDKQQRFIRQLKILGLDKEKQQYREILANNIVLGMGKQAFIPEGVPANHAKITHTDHLLPYLKQQFTDLNSAHEFIVIGSGQSAGETTLYLLNHYPNARVHLCFRSFALKETDNSPFVNQQYHAAAIADFYQLNDLARVKTLADLKSSNYAVMDSEVLARLTQISYEDLLQNKSRLMIHAGLEMNKVFSSARSVEVIFNNIYEHTIKTISGDGLILATGYHERQLSSLFGELEKFLLKKTDGSYQISADYRLLTESQVTAGIYLQGYCENTHGLSDPTLAVLATRADQILQAILNHCPTAAELVLGDQICS